MNEENIGKCLVISMCFVMSSFTLVVDGKTFYLLIKDFWAEGFMWNWIYAKDY